MQWKIMKAATLILMTNSRIAKKGLLKTLSPLDTVFIALTDSDKKHKTIGYRVTLNDKHG
jgi:hypothetical protein